MPPSIPTCVQRAAVISFCEDLGLDPRLVAGLQFTVYGVYVSYYAMDAKGARLSDGEGPALHRIYLAFEDKETR